VYHALKDGNEFFGVFKKEKMIKNLAYVHINEKGIIKDISACNEKNFFINLDFFILFFEFKKQLASISWVST